MAAASASFSRFISSSALSRSCTGSSRHETAVAQDQVALAVACDVELVRHHDDGDALFVELLEHAHHLNGGLAVEIAGRFIREEDLGVVGECARDCDALLLAAGKLVGKMIGPVREADDLEAVERPLAHLARRVALLAVHHGQFRVFQRGGTGEQVEALEYEADLLVADVGELVAVELGDVDPVEQVATARRTVEAAEQVHERGLAGAARAHERHEFAAVNLDRDAAHGMHGNLAGVVDLVNLLDFDDGSHGRRVRSGRGSEPARAAASEGIAGRRSRGGGPAGQGGARDDDIAFFEPVDHGGVDCRQ